MSSPAQASSCLPGLAVNCVPDAECARHFADGIEHRGGNAGDLEKFLTVTDGIAPGCNRPEFIVEFISNFVTVNSV